MSAAKAHAKISGWVPDAKRTGPAYGLVHSAKEGKGQPVWRAKAWFLEAQAHDPNDLTVSVSIVPAMAESHCVVSLRGAALKEMSIALRTKLNLGEPKPMFGIGNGWTLSGDLAKPNESMRLLLVTEQELAAGPRIGPPGGGATLPGPTEMRTFAGVISFVVAPHG